MATENTSEIQSKGGHSKVLNFISDQPWLATENTVKQVIDIAQGFGDPKAVEAKLGRPLNNTQTVKVRDGVAVLSVNGPIFRYASWFHQISGGTSIQVLSKDFNTALEDNDVKAILLNLDSPGGQANGVSEFANMVFKARGIKPIYAFVGGNAASGAYWIASAAEKIVISDTAILGSIGTVIQIQDTSEKDKKSGVRTFDLVSRKSPLKRVDPNTEQGQEQIMKMLDTLTDVFISAVATHRGVETSKVEKDFGKGGVMVGQENIDAGLADEIGSFESILTVLQNKTDEEELNMAEDKKEVITKEVITIESMNKNHPDIAAALRQEGAKAECIRIKDVQSKLIAGHDELVQTMMFDGTTTADQAASKILDAEKAKMATKQTDIKSDADDIEKIDADDDTPDADDASVEAMVEGAEASTK